MLLSLRISFLLVLLPLLTYGQNYSSLAVENISEELVKSAYYVVRYDNTTVELKSQDNIHIQHAYAHTVFNKKGHTHLNFYASYKEGSSKIKFEKLLYLDDKGNIIKEVKKSDLEDYSSFDGFSLLTDSRSKYYEFENDQYPITIVAEYSKESKNTCWLPDWRPYYSFRQSIENAKYQIINNSNIIIDHLIIDNDFPLIKDKGTLTFEMSNVPVSRKERFLKPSSHIFPIVRFRPVAFNFEGHEGKAQSWNAYGNWIYNSFLKENEPINSEDQILEIKALIAEEDSPKEIAQKLYEYIQNNTRYVNIALEDGGLNPMHGKDVHALKYGDCKALSNYYIQLLSIFDIPANYVLVNADSEHPLDMNPNFYNQLQANHAIVNIPMGNDTLWVDCTSNYNPLGFLGAFTDDRVVLSVNEQGGTITKTPRYSFEKNNSIYQLNINLTDPKNTAIEFSQDNYGIQAMSRFFTSKMKQSELEEYLINEHLDRFNNPNIHSTKINFNKDLLLLNEQYNFSVANFTEKLGDYIQFAQNLISLEVPKIKKDSKREFEIYFPRDFRKEVIIDYKLPENYKLKGEIPPIKLESQYGTYQWSLSQNDNEILSLHKIFKLKKGLYKASEYNEIKSFFDKILKQEKQLITIQNRT